MGALTCSVLVLNRNYMALRVVNVKRAMTLLYRQLAEVVHIEKGQYISYDFESWRNISELKRQFQPDGFDWLRTVRFEIAVPRIIRLLFYEKLPRGDVKFNRRNIFARDGNHCQYCGKKFPTTELSLDHVVPRSQNGRSTWDNVVCACIECNIKKGGRTPEQAGMKLISVPKRPRRSPVLGLKLTDARYASWKQFLDYAYWDVELK